MKKKIGMAVGLLALSSVAEAACKIEYQEKVIGRFEATEKRSEFVIDPDSDEPQAFRCIKGPVPGFGSMNMINCNFGKYEREGSDSKFKQIAYAWGMGSLGLWVWVGDTDVFKLTCD